MRRSEDYSPTNIVNKPEKALPSIGIDFFKIGPVDVPGGKMYIAGFDVETDGKCLSHAIGAFRGAESNLDDVRQEKVNELVRALASAELAFETGSKYNLINKVGKTEPIIPDSDIYGSRDFNEVIAELVEQDRVYLGEQSLT